MSSRTPQECVDLAADASAPREAREDAIDELRTANECDELAGVATNDDLESELRRYALQAMATPQCDDMLETLAADGDLEDSLQGEAESLLGESADD